MTFADLEGATVVEADCAGIRLRLPDGREAEVIPAEEDFPSQKNVPGLFIYEARE